MEKQEKEQNNKEVKYGNIYVCVYVCMSDWGLGGYYVLFISCFGMNSLWKKKKTNKKKIYYKNRNMGNRIARKYLNILQN